VANALHTAARHACDRAYGVPLLHEMLGEGDEGATLDLLAHRTQQHYLVAHTAVRSWFTTDPLNAEQVCNQQPENQGAML
jgi:hypothetical protein